MTIGERIKKARLALGYSAEQVAANLGVSPATIYRYENGDIAKLPSKHIKPLAEYLCVSPSYLMDWKEEEKIPFDIQCFAEKEPTADSDVCLSDFLTAYKSLTPAGKDYIQQQVHIAQAMFSEESAEFNKHE